MPQYSESEVLDLLDDGIMDARDLLRQHCPKAAKRFHKLAADLHKLMLEVQEVFPDANYYSASGTVHLLLGDSHSGYGEAAQQQLVAETARGLDIGGGDW